MQLHPGFVVEKKFKMTLSAKNGMCMDLADR